MRYLLFLLFLPFLFTISNAQVQFGADIDGEAQDDYFGSAVSLSSDGQFLAVGADQNDGGGNSAGHVRVFQRVGSSWVQRGSDIDGASAGHYFGTSVAISDDGNRIVAGSKYSNASGGASGHANVFSYNGSSWTQLGGDLNGEASFDYAGHAVDMSADGTTIAVGATHNDGAGNQDCGHVRVFTYSGGSWVQKGTDIDGESPYDNSGHSVSLSGNGNIVAIGAYKNEGNGTEAGHVRVYEYSGGTWSQIGADIDGDAGDRFGWDVSLTYTGDKLAVGATHNTNSVGYQAGAARVYRRVGNSWSKEGGDLVGESLVDWFGYSVAISPGGQVLAVGAIRNDGSGPDGGSVKVYSSGGNNWTNQVGSDIDSENSGDWFGYSVDISSGGLYIAISAINNNPTGNAQYTGHVRCISMAGLVSNEELEVPLTESFKVFPNPNDGLFTLELGKVLEFVTVTVSNVTGKVLYQNDFENIESTQLDLEGTTGVYFIKIEVPNQPAKTVKVLKQ